ncbi:hypothetical protein CR513_02070, partial [Mucuna pruriens]
MKLPFMHFEWSVLHVLNVAPTQLHPNGWAFIRAFELLCEDIGRAPSLGVFFWFFSVRQTKKNRFFQVAPSDVGPNLLMDSFGELFFPLYWTPQPAVLVSIDRDDLEEWEVEFVEELGDMSTLSSEPVEKRAVENGSGDQERPRKRAFVMGEPRVMHLI